jgi:hypothetical protein
MILHKGGTAFVGWKEHADAKQVRLYPGLQNHIHY